MTREKTTTVNGRKHNGRFFAFAFLVSVSAVQSFGQISRPAAILDVSIPPNSSIAVALPFDPFSSDLFSLLGEQLGENASILLWNAPTQSYESPTNASSSSAGDAFWIVNESSESKQITLSGLVSSEHKTITVIPQLSLIGNPSVSVISNNNVALEGDGITDPRFPESNADTLPIGQGMWYHRNQPDSALIEIESPLSAWPEQDNAPGIISLTVNATGTVQIVVTDEPGTEVTLYGQDVPLDGAMQPDGWDFISDGIIGENLIAIFEEVSPGHSEIGSRLRCYLAAVNGTDLKSFFEQSSNLLDGDDGSGSELSSFQSNSGESTGAGFEINDGDLSHQQGTNEFQTTTRTRSRVIYVSQTIGKDEFTGEKQMRTGNDGPKHSVNAALAEASSSDTVVVLDGNYTESIRIRPGDGVVHIKGVVRIKSNPGSENVVNTTSIVTNKPGISAEGGD